MKKSNQTDDMLPFLQAIAAAPADETSRLIFADWLEGARRLAGGISAHRLHAGSDVGLWCKLC